MTVSEPLKNWMPFGMDQQSSVSFKARLVPDGKEADVLFAGILQADPGCSGINTNAPAWASYSFSPSETWALPVWIKRISSSPWCLCLGIVAPEESPL